MAKLDLDWINVFVEIYKTQNVSRAALALGMEQASASIVAQTEFLVNVPRQLGHALAEQERVKVLEPPLPLAAYKVKQHWHERFNLDAGNAWLRKTMAILFSGKAPSH